MKKLLFLLSLVATFITYPVKTLKEQAAQVTLKTLTPADMPEFVNYPADIQLAVFKKESITNENIVLYMAWLNELIDRPNIQIPVDSYLGICADFLYEHRQQLEPSATEFLDHETSVTTALKKILKPRFFPICSELKQLNFGDEVRAIAWSPNGKQLAAGFAYSNMGILDAITGETLFLLAEPSFVLSKRCITSLAWSPNGKWLASGSRDKTIRIWNAATGCPIHELIGHTLAITSVAWSPDGKQLVSGSEDGTIRLWDAATSQQIGKLSTGYISPILSVAWSPDGKQLASGSQDGSICLWSAVRGYPMYKLKETKSYATSVAWSPDGKWVASGGYRKIRLWNVATGKQVRKLKGHAKDVTSMAWSPDGKHLAAGSSDHTSRVWNVTTGDQTCELRHAAVVVSVAWSPDSKQLASGSLDKTIRLWGMDKRKTLYQLLKGVK